MSCSSQRPLFAKSAFSLYPYECFMCFNHNVPSTMENMRYRTLILFYFSGLWLRWCIVLVHASCVNYDTSEGSPLWENFATRLLRLQAIRHGWPVATLNWFQEDFLWNLNRVLFFFVLFCAVMMLLQLFTQLADASIALGDIKTLFSVLFRFGDFDVALSCLCGGEQLVGGAVGWSHSPTLLPPSRSL